MISYLMGKEGESDQNGGVDQQDGNLGDRKGTRDRKEGREGRISYLEKPMYSME